MNSSYSIKKQLMPLFLNLEQATNLVVERARQLVNQLVEQRGHDKPPFSPEEFARLQGVNIERADLGKTSAVLLRLHEGYTIKLNQNHNLARQNFSLAHEIGHILLHELKVEINTENIEYRTFNPQAHALARAKVRERLCDISATELLMPELVFKKYLSGFGVSVHSVERLASVFRVSIRAAALRIAEVSEEPCVALLWQPWLRNRSKGLRLAWSAGPGRKSSGKSSCMPLHTYVRPPSTLHEAYESDKSVKSFKLFKIDNGVKRCPMESKSFGRGETRYVVSLAFTDM